MYLFFHRAKIISKNSIKIRCFILSYRDLERRCFYLLNVIFSSLLVYFDYLILLNRKDNGLHIRPVPNASDRPTLVDTSRR